ncbi:MAG TPA: Sir2 family NAD-dependent protein deacetylase [Acidimicrobiales bacterium]|nr:Sir2 family NAD-dependent protein deacetylase [Acidimicrobiales bacterium]
MSAVRDLDTVRRWIADAERVVVLTGAGISTDSGIPDFRGPNGLWTKNPAAEKASDIRYYLADPDVRRAAWQSRVANRDRDIEPNAGHRALVDLEASGRLHTLVTQNIDGLHQRAGTSPDLVVEIHGNTVEAVCLMCADRLPMAEVLDRVAAGEEDPACRRCGGILKSATISFGQSLVEADLRRAEAAATASDLLVAVGTTLTVYPIAALPVVAQRAGARVVTLNGEPTDFDTQADAVLRGRISDLLPALVATLPRAPPDSENGEWGQRTAGLTHRLTDSVSSTGFVGR